MSDEEDGPVLSAFTPKMEPGTWQVKVLKEQDNENYRTVLSVGHQHFTICEDDNPQRCEWFAKNFLGAIDKVVGIEKSKATGAIPSAEDPQLALEESIALAEEGWAYAGEYFQEKWRCAERIADLRLRAGVGFHEGLPRDRPARSDLKLETETVLRLDDGFFKGRFGPQLTLATKLDPADHQKVTNLLGELAILRERCETPEAIGQWNGALTAAHRAVDEAWRDSMGSGAFRTHVLGQVLKLKRDPTATVEGFSGTIVKQRDGSLRLLSPILRAEEFTPEDEAAFIELVERAGKSTDG